jgi:tRNA-dependent cyclodipeptide synthase
VDLIRDIEGEAYERGVRIADEKGCALIPLCPANGHFTRENIVELLECVAQNFSKIHLFVPDEPTLLTYEAVGYPTGKASQKLSKERRQLTKRGGDAMQGRPHKLWDWESIKDHPTYIAEIERLESLYSRHGSLWKTVRSETRQVLFNTLLNMRRTSSAHIHPSLAEVDASFEVPDERIEIGTPYVLNELAFLTAAPTILNEDRLAYVYHREWMLDEYIEGKFDGDPKPNLGFAVIR